MLPEGAVEPLPSRVMVLSGSVMVCALPASATGGNGATFAVMVTGAVDVAPLLSVTVISKTYTPSERPVTVVTALFDVVMVSPVGPDTLRHS